MKNSASGTTFNVGVVSGGTRSNVVAAEAMIEGDVRFSRMKEAQRISELMRNLEPFDKRKRLTAAGGLNRGPLERTEGVVRLYQRAREVAGCLGFELRERSVGGASDGNFVAALGVPVLDGLGPDGDGAHATHEHVLISDIVRRCAMLAGLIASLE